MKSLVVLVALLLILVQAPLVAATTAAERPGSGVCSAPIASAEYFGSTAFVASEDERVVRVGPNILLQQLKGDAALAHLANLMSRRPNALGAARADLVQRGFRETDEVYVERILRLSVADSFGPGAIVPAQDYWEQNAQGEIVFWSFDDGDDSTWEGTIYFEEYSTGIASQTNGQIDASNQQHEWVFHNLVWSSGRPGGPPPYRPSAFMPATVILAGGGGWSAWANCWRQNVVGGCGAAAVGCISVGPGWPACFGSTCVGVELGFGLACFFEY